MYVTNRGSFVVNCILSKKLIGCWYYIGTYITIFVKLHGLLHTYSYILYMHAHSTIAASYIYTYMYSLATQNAVNNSYKVSNISETF